MIDVAFTPAGLRPAGVAVLAAGIAPVADVGEGEQIGAPVDGRDTVAA